MKETMNILGYGFSREGRDADWQELEAELPAKGPDCPLTGDLLDLALNREQQAEAARVREHLDGCDYCRGRFEAQKRAIAQANAFRADAAGPSLFESVSLLLEERIADRLVGEMKLVPAAPPTAAGPRLAAGSVPSLAAACGPLQSTACGPREHSFEVALRKEGDKAGSDALNGLVFVRMPESAAASTWSVVFSAPVKTPERKHGNTESRLRDLSGREVLLVLKTADFADVKSLTTRLDWDPLEKQLVSLKRTIEIDDPTRLKHLEFTRCKRIVGLKTS